jgi:ribonuclease HI
MNSVTIFCDGSAIGNPGPGGWGVVVQFSEEGKEKRVQEIGGFAEHTTNNRMELTAAIEALKLLKHTATVTIKTDSQYVIQGITKWVFGWQKNGWQTSQKKEVLNKDLWEILVSHAKEHTVTWEHVRAHVGVALNERVDMIANGFARKETVTLCVANEKEYAEFLKGMPKARVVGSTKSKAYAYVSLVDGVVQKHATWSECEAHVKGKKAQYKKVSSKEEEQELCALWSKG